MALLPRRRHPIAQRHRGLISSQLHIQAPEHVRIRCGTGHARGTARLGQKTRRRKSVHTVVETSQGAEERHGTHWTSRASHRHLPRLQACGILNGRRRRASRGGDPWCDPKCWNGSVCPNQHQKSCAALGWHLPHNSCCPHPTRPHLPAQPAERPLVAIWLSFD